MSRDAEQAGFKLVRTEKYLKEDFIFVLKFNVIPVSFTQSSQEFPPADTNSIGLGDFDGDGDLDVFVSFYGDGSNSIWYNDRK
ncbi:MAG: hypothetical protein JXB26_12420 [Candidatus Aminicenantes bacterium]|nr:hypothetical protein [Candidatus Aminicenantes bacterium]